RSFRRNGASGTSFVPGPPGTTGDSLFRSDIFEKLRAQAQATDSPLSDLFAFAAVGKMTAAPSNQAEIINGQAVSGGYYAGLRAHPALGPAIPEEDNKPGAAPVVVLSHQFWQERFAANPAVIGRPLKLNRQFSTIVGVTPPAFIGALQVGYPPAVTLPLAFGRLLRGQGAAAAKADVPDLLLTLM